jgi:hypothetical protein
MSLKNFNIINQKGRVYYGYGINYLNVTNVVNKRGLDGNVTYYFSGQTYASFLSLLLFLDSLFFSDCKFIPESQVNYPFVCTSNTSDVIFKECDFSDIAITSGSDPCIGNFWGSNPTNVTFVDVTVTNCSSMRRSRFCCLVLIMCDGED